jgi:1-acyl-sn-glycerol-3-phosphate acyltransferase
MKNGGNRMALPDVLYKILKYPLQFIYKTNLNISVIENEMEGLKGPAFVIGNHVAAHDSQISILFSGRMIRMLAAEANWQTQWKKSVFQTFGVIPVVRKKTDTRAVRAMKKAVEQGYCVGLYPEAERTWDGKTLKILPSTCKLAKMLGVPVYAVITKGLHLSRPRWAVKPRRGIVEVEIRQVLTAEQVETLSKKEIQEAMQSSIDFSEFDWQRGKMIPFRGKDKAESIEHLLYICDKCEAVNAIKSKGDEFYCVKCKGRHSIDNFGFIVGRGKFNTTAKWNEWQRTFIEKIIDKGFIFKMKDIALDMFLHDNKLSHMVDLQFTPDGFNVYFPKKRRYSKIDISEVDSCNIVFKDQVELFIHGIKHVLTFDTKKNHMSIKLLEDIFEQLLSN